MLGFSKNNIYNDSTKVEIDKLIQKGHDVGGYAVNQGLNGKYSEIEAEMRAYILVGGE